MSNYALSWKTAKDKAFKSNSLPPEMVMELSQGYDFGPALAAFGKADSFEKRKKAVVAVLKAKTAYEKAIKDVLKSVKDPKQKAALSILSNSIEAIWVDVDKATQPVRPSGKMVNYVVLTEYNLAPGLKLKYLDVKATTVTCYIEIDKVLDDLIKAGEESLKVQHLGEVAKAEIEKVRSAFTDTLKDIEDKIAKKPEIAADKTKEANEVLKHYARIVEDRVNAAVQVEWAKYAARRQHLSDFKLKSGLKITLGVVAIGVAAASVGLSFGTAWINIFAICKGVVDLVQNIRTLTQGIEKTHGVLQTDISKIQVLNLQREEAKKKGAGQKASKTLEAAKELANSLLPVTKLMARSASTVEASAQQLLGQVSKIEDSADKTVGALNKVLKQVPSLPEKVMTAAQKEAAKNLNAAIEKYFSEISAMHKKAQEYGDFGDKCLAATKRLKSEDTWVAGSSTCANCSVRGVALYGAANFVFQCALAGKSLIPI